MFMIETVEGSDALGVDASEVPVVCHFEVLLHGLGFRVSGLGLRVQSSGFSVSGQSPGSRFMVQGICCRVSGLLFRV